MSRSAAVAQPPKLAAQPADAGARPHIAAPGAAAAVHLLSARVVSLLLAAVVLASALPRIYGPGWYGIASPASLREVEGHTVAWEHTLPLAALPSILGNDPSPAIGQDFNSDHYRALVPLYASAILSRWLHSIYWGFMGVELLVWWLCAVALYPLAIRLGASRPAGLGAAILFAASPIVLQQLGNNVMHVASSASLVPAFAAAWIAVEDEDTPFWWRSAGLAAVLFAASLFYNYHLVVIPCVLALALFARRRATWGGVVAAGSTGFALLTAAAHALLASANVPVRPHLNEPLFVLTARLAQWSDPAQRSAIARTLRLLPPLFVNAYGPLIVALVAIGACFARKELRVLLLVGTLAALADALIYPVPWIVMNGYPFMYVCAGIAIMEVPRVAARALARYGGTGDTRSPWNAAARRAPLVSGGTSVLFLAAAVWSTNLDLAGDYSFVVRWWNWWYFVH